MKIRFTYRCAQVFERVKMTTNTYTPTCRKRNTYVSSPRMTIKKLEEERKFVFFRCGHPKLQIRPTILISLECAGCQQRNGTSPVCIRCMVFEIQLLLIHGFQKVAALCFPELGPHKSRKNNCISKTINVYKWELYHCIADNLHIPMISIS